MAYVHPWTRRALKRTVWTIALGVGIPISAMALILIAAGVTGNWSIARYSGIAGFSGFFGMAGLFFFMPGRKKVLKYRGRVCGNCLFPLEGLDDKGVCPECAHPYEIDKTIMGWERDLNIRHLAEDLSVSTDQG